MTQDKDNRAPQIALRYSQPLWVNKLFVGEVRPGGGGDYAVSVEETSHGSRTYRVAGEESHVNIIVSRVSPAAIVEAHGTGLELFAGDKDLAISAQIALEGGMPRTPRRYAASDGDTVTLGMLDGAGTFMDGVEHGWLLLWYGADTWFRHGHAPERQKGRGDAPFLLVCSQPPVVSLAGLSDPPSLGLDRADSGPAGLGPEGCLAFEFPDAGAKIAMLPLEGYILPSADWTQGWSDAGALPEAVRRRCDWWAQRLAEVPIDVIERWDYDFDADTATASAEFSYKRVRPGGQRMAPLAPMLELARRQGFPVEVDGAVQDAGMPTYCGPYAVIDGASGYVARVRGLGRYALEEMDARLPAEMDGGAAAAHAEMIEEVDRMIEVGHLAPLNLPTKFASGWWHAHVIPRKLYSAPGQTLSTLAAAMPFLDSGRRSRVLDYLQELRDGFPPEIVAFLPSDIGARREAWTLPEEYVKDVLAKSDGFWREKPAMFHAIDNFVPSQMLYDLAAYYRATGEDRMHKDGFVLDDAMAPSIRPWMERGDWATLGWYSWPLEQRDDSMWGSYGWSMPVDINRAAAGYIGLARLARMTGERDMERLGLACLARTLTHRFAVAKYAGWLYEQGVLPQPEDYNPAEDPREVIITEEYAIVGYNYGLWPGKILPRWSKEKGPYTDMVPELARFFVDFLKPEAMNFAKQTAAFYPDAFVTMGTPHYVQEWFQNYPQDTWQIFMVHAWILGESGDWLRRRLDVPLVPRGDLYHIDKLIAILQAYGTQSWKPL